MITMIGERITGAGGKNDVHGGWPACPMAEYTLVMAALIAI
jgi:hypothetical protein